MCPDALPSHFPCRPHVLPLPANNCSWLVTAHITVRALRACASFQARHATYGIRKCFLFLLQCQLTLVVIQVSPGLIEPLAQTTGALAWIWVTAVGQPCERGRWPSVRFTQHVWGSYRQRLCDLSLHCPFSLTLLQRFLSSQPLFPLEKSIPCSTCPSNPEHVERLCSGSLVTSSS